MRDARQGGCGGIVSAIAVLIIAGLVWGTNAYAGGMDQAVTVGAVLVFVGIVGGLFVVVLLAFFVLWLFNPFRSGH